MHSMKLPALQTFQLRGLTLRNRFIKAATYEGMARDGTVTKPLISFHAQMAERGVALTTVSYGAVSKFGRTFSDQLLVDHASVAGLRRLANAVHSSGGAVSIQLSHAGGFSKFQQPSGPSRRINLYGLAAGYPVVKAMTEDEILATIEDFTSAASFAREAGIDAIELHLGHGYLLSQFLSPVTNRRRDHWGGGLENRVRFPEQVIRSVRSAVGDDFPILVKANLQDGVRGGLTLKDSIQSVRKLLGAGIDAIIPSGGMVQKNAFYLLRGDVPIKQMAKSEDSYLQGLALRALAPFLIRRYPYQSTFFFDDASELKAEIDAPVGLLGGIDSSQAVDRALSSGFEFVVLGRALLSDPDFIARYAAGQRFVARCNQCNECIASMHRGVRCTLDLPGSETGRTKIANTKRK